LAERVGWIGLGIMGSRMAANLVRAGYEVVAYNRTRETAEAWAAEHGAELADSPAAAAEAADVLVTMVVDGPQVQAVLLGEDGAAEGLREGMLAVDCSTIAPSEARAIGEELGRRGVGFVDAPVTGSSPKAQDGTLTIMCGGTEADVERARPLFEVMGETIVPCGTVGDGQAVKLVNNAVAIANAATLAQALVVADAEGLDLDALVQVLTAGSGGSAMVGLKAGPMRAHDYATLFKVEHMLKDVRLCLEEAQAAGAPFPAAAAARDLLVAAMARGYADADFAAIVEGVEGLAGHRIGA
jgi:3-hydroxyisobutyrate dehydrogenase